MLGQGDNASLPDYGDDSADGASDTSAAPGAENASPASGASATAATPSKRQRGTPPNATPPLPAFRIR